MQVNVYEAFWGMERLTALHDLKGFPQGLLKEWLMNGLHATIFRRVERENVKENGEFAVIRWWNLRLESSTTSAMNPGPFLCMHFFCWWHRIRLGEIGANKKISRWTYYGSIGTWWIGTAKLRWGNGILIMWMDFYNVGDADEFDTYFVFLQTAIFYKKTKY